MSTPNEHRQVLDMLAEGKITADEAQRLLERLGSPATTSNTGPSESSVITTTVHSGDPKGRSSNAKPKYFRVLVTSGDGDEVNIRIPLGLIRAGLKLSTVLPNDARDKLEKKGVDLSKLSDLQGDELIEALRELSIDVDSSGGDVVRMFCE